jgi:hypothetical protein
VLTAAERVSPQNAHWPLPCFALSTRLRPARDGADYPPPATYLQGTCRISGMATTVASVPSVFRLSTGKPRQRQQRRGGFSPAARCPSSAKHSAVSVRTGKCLSAKATITAHRISVRAAAEAPNAPPPEPEAPKLVRPTSRLCIAQVRRDTQNPIYLIDSNPKAKVPPRQAYQRPLIPSHDLET